MSDLWLPETKTAEIGSGDPMPPGPYAPSLYRSPEGWCEPFTVRSTVTGQAVAGHVPSRACADAIADALNLAAEGGAMKVRKPTKPTETDTRLLRLVAQRGGKIVVTLQNGEAHFTTKDGFALPDISARKWIKSGWVKAEDRPLFGELAQCYTIETGFA